MKELEIRPDSILKIYLELSVQDANEMQAESNRFVEVLCLACCSMFVLLDPLLGSLRNFIGIARRIIGQMFFSVVAELLREKMFKPKAKDIYEIVNEIGMIL